jgi:hypothetical protein
MDEEKGLLAADERADDGGIRVNDKSIIINNNSCI